MHACLLIPYVDTTSFKTQTQEKKKERNRAARKLFGPEHLKYKGRRLTERTKLVREREIERQQKKERKKECVEHLHFGSSFEKRSV